MQFIVKEIFLEIIGHVKYQDHLVKTRFNEQIATKSIYMTGLEKKTFPDDIDRVNDVQNNGNVVTSSVLILTFGSS